MPKALYLTTGLLVLVAIPFLPGAEGEVEKKALEAPDQYQELERFLVEYRTSWLPDRRRALLKIAQAKREAFAPGLAYVLGERNHPARDVALMLTAELKLVSLRVLIRRIASEGLYRLRPRAIIVAHQLGPWRDEEVLRFLNCTDNRVVVAALSLPNSKPWPILLDLMGSEDATVVRASIQALPPVLTQQQAQGLLTLAMSGDETRRLSALKALSRYSITESTETLLTQIATAGAPSLQWQALKALAAKGSRLDSPQQIYWIVINSSAETEVKALALYCLEKTNSFDTEALAHDSRLMPTLLRYHVARCLIQRNDRRGLDILFGILADANSNKVQVDPRDLAATRQLLGRLSGLGVGATAEDWMRWSSEMDDTSRSPLPVPPLLDA